MKHVVLAINQQTTSGEAFWPAMGWGDLEEVNSSSHVRYIISSVQPADSTRSDVSYINYKQRDRRPRIVRDFTLVFDRKSTC